MRQRRLLVKKGALGSSILFYVPKSNFGRQLEPKFLTQIFVNIRDFDPEVISHNGTDTCSLLLLFVHEVILVYVSLV